MIEILWDTLQREIAAARQALDRAEMLHDSLYQNYIDKLVTVKEYMELRERHKAYAARYDRAKPERTASRRRKPKG